MANEGMVKIGDFGMAADIGPGEDGQEGDAKYMAPELLNSRDRYEQHRETLSLTTARNTYCIPLKTLH